MPGARLLSVEGDQQLARLAASLRRHAGGQELNQALRQELATIGRDAAGRVRSSIRSIPSKGQTSRAGRRSLRAAMARAVESKVRTTRRPALIVRVNPRRMPAGEHNLPGYMEGAKPFNRWRHSTFGHRPWVTQRSHPYFATTLRPAAAQAERAGARVLDRYANQISRG